MTSTTDERLAINYKLPKLEYILDCLTKPEYSEGRAAATYCLELLNINQENLGKCLELRRKLELQLNSLDTTILTRVLADKDLTNETMRKTAQQSRRLKSPDYTHLNELLVDVMQDLETFKFAKEQLGRVFTIITKFYSDS